MLVFALLLTVPQALPQGPAAWAQVEVQGTVELSKPEAQASARRKAEVRVADAWRERGQQVFAESASPWLPGFLGERVLQRWLVDVDIPSATRVLDADVEKFHHEWGESYRATLLVAEYPGFRAEAEESLRRAVARAETRVQWIGGGTLGLWAVLAVLLSWIDRLSRGYMTKRLWVLGLAVGAGAPTLALLI